MDSIVKFIAWASIILASLIVLILMNMGGAPIHRSICIDNEFIKYVYDNNMEMVKATYSISNSSTYKDARSCRDGNAVDIAAKNANEEIFFYFIDKGAKVGYWGRSDTYSSAYKGNNQNILNYLYEKEISTPAQQELALKSAISNGDIERVKALVEKGVDIHSNIYENESILVDAVLNDDLHMTKYLIQHGCDVNKRGRPKRIPSLKYRPIRLAVKTGSIKMAKLLIENGASVNPPFQYNSPLMEAVSENKAEMAKFLVENGSDVNATMKNGRTALMDSVSSVNTEIARLLVENGADVNATEHGRTALAQAISHSKLSETNQYHISQEKLKEFEEILKPQPLSGPWPSRVKKTINAKE